MQYYQNKPIRMWAVEDRPREKLRDKGLQSLTNAELIASLLSTGTKDLSALDLARNLIDEFGNLKNISNQTIDELTQVFGIGPAKATIILVAFELARRKEKEESQIYTISCSMDIYKYMKPIIGHLQQEVVYLLFLNSANRIIGEKKVSMGGTNEAAVDYKIILREALARQAQALCLCHNHPSGSLVPSRADMLVTRRLKKATDLVGINLLDHVIVTTNGHFSFKDNDMLSS